ncbi:MAG: NADH-quinone oxidoreductase subunit NuoH [Phycisphaerales bacterium]|nr:NADH-quinone oxidoreductase subunit NuoH [Phycisphaerales bacterium]
MADVTALIVRRRIEYHGLSALVAGLARIVYGAAAPVLRRFPGAIFLSAVVAVVVGVWAHYLLFEFVDVGLIGNVETNATEAMGWFGGPLTLDEIRAGLAFQSVPLAGVLCYAAYPLQYAIVRDVVGMGGILGFISVIPLYSIWWERKVAGRIQSRSGPMRVGGWHGWAQTIADGMKLITKEDLCPDSADRPLFKLAPYLAFVPAILAFFALPFGTYWVFRQLDVALVFILAMLGVEVLGVIIAGWASNNKWSVYGAMREACQMVSYEIPMGMALLVPIMAAGTLSLTAVGDMQSGGWTTWLVFRNPFTFAAALMYYVASLASCKRAPFDLPESESELVAGFHTEYSGFRWSLFFFAEYAAMFVVSGLCVILFLGAWYSPLPMSWAEGLGDSLPARAVKGVLFAGPLWFVTKCVFLIYVQIWLRWTLPRIRIDQVLYACVQVMLPMMMVILLGHTLYELFVPTGGIVWRVFNVLLSLIGGVAAVAMVVVAVYGYANRRRLVGSLGLELLPGS